MGSHNLKYELLEANTVVSDPGNGGTIGITAWNQVCLVVTASAETRTLAQPHKAGLLATVVLATDGGTLTLTVTGGVDESNDTSVTLDDAGDFVTFFSIGKGGSYYWRPLQAFGVTGFLQPVPKLKLDAQGGANAASGLLMGVGTSADPATTSTADDKFVEIRAKTTATSGDNRLGYFRYEIGAAGGGECMRAFTYLSAASTTVRGAHVSLVPSAAGAVSGLGTALSATLHTGNTAFTTGNVACIEANPYADGEGALPTEHGAIRVATGGDATGGAKFLNVLHVSPQTGQVGNKAAKLMVCNADVTAGGGAAAGGLQVRVNGTQYWLPLYSI